MIFDKFSKEILFWWINYFKGISKAQQEGRLRSSEGALLIGSEKDLKVLYPNILLVSQFPGFYVAELVGGVERFGGLTIKFHRDSSIYRYLSHFDDANGDGVFEVEGDQLQLSKMCLAQSTDFDRAKERFPSIGIFKTRIMNDNGKGSPIKFGDNFKSVVISNSLLVNHSNNIYRCKNILHMLIVKKNLIKRDVLAKLEMAAGQGNVQGVHTVCKGQDVLTIAGHLQSLALLPSLRETTLGEFLKLHPEVIMRVFNSSHVEYEPSFAWIEHDGTCDDQFINPDMMVRRGDGFYDIYDLKTALLDKKSVASSERKRRRFINCVYDGVAQLANYREYFKYDGNAAYAKEKYGIEVFNPKLVLVVGSWENVNYDEVLQASRSHGDDIEIIDYDTLCQKFISIGLL